MQGGRTPVLQRRGQEEILEGGRDPFEHLQTCCKASGRGGSRLPRFSGGLVGYLGYDMVRFIERLPELTPGPEPCPRPG